MTHVLIATPTAGGVVKSRFATTLVEVFQAVKDAGWDATFVTVDGCYVSMARNYFANTLLNQAQFTHLAMIDSDMFFDGHVLVHAAAGIDSQHNGQRHLRLAIKHRDLLRVAILGKGEIVPGESAYWRAVCVGYVDEDIYQLHIHMNWRR